MFWSSFDGNVWAPQQVGVGGGTNQRPAIAEFQGKLYAAWKGAGSDDRMFWSSFDGNVWAPQQVGIGGGTSVGPALAAFQNRLYAVWKGAGRDPRMFWSSFDGSTWTSQQVGVGGGTDTGPALAVYRTGLNPADDRLFAAWKGVAGDERMFWSSFDGSTWSPQQVGVGGGTSARPAIASFRKPLFAAWKGVDGDERMFWSFMDLDRTPRKPVLAAPAIGAAMYRFHRSSSGAIPVPEP